MHRARETRYPTNFPIAIVADDGPCQAVVRDISSAGAKLTGVEHLKVGARITIPGKDGAAGAMIRWNSDGFAGIVFYPLAPLDLPERLLAHVTSAAAPKKASYPRLQAVR